MIGVKGLDGGADDYLVKPFALEELLARLRVIVRRSTGYVESTIELHGLVISLARNTVEWRPGVLSTRYILYQRFPRPNSRRIC